MGALRVNRWIAQIDDELLALASSCCYLERFAVADAPVANLKVRRVAALDRSHATALDGLSPAAGSYAVQDDVLLVDIPASPPSAEASLRAAFQLATLRQGGLLLHGSGVAFSGAAAIAIGPSGAGKSTLARFGLGAGGALLSDETIALYPDATACGSPFFSDADLPSGLESASVAGILILEKGTREEIAPVSSAEATAALLSHAYRPCRSEMTQASLLSRARDLASRTRVYRLTFRNDAAAGAFVKRWVLESLY
jgi:hypothetical protein